jgi:hypothetical protein
MTEILHAIQNGTDFAGAVTAFRSLSKEDKLGLLEALRAVRQESLGTFLNGVYPDESDKEVRKGIKKLLFRLKSMGVPVLEPEPSGDPAYRRIEERREHKGFMSSYDEMGTRVIVASFQTRTNSFGLINAISHFSRGLLELTIVPVDRRDLGKIIGEYQKGVSSSVAFVEISPRYATYLMEEGAGLSGKHADDIKQLKQFTAHVTSQVETPQDLRNLSVPEGTEPTPPEGVVLNPLFERFSLSWDQMEADKKELDAIQNPTIALPQHMVEERRKAFLDTVLRSDRLQTLKHPLIRMMEDYAYIFHALGDHAAFRACLKSAENEEDLTTVFSHFILKAIEKGTEEKPPEPGLIVHPYEQVRR